MDTILLIVGWAHCLIRFTGTLRMHTYLLVQCSLSIHGVLQKNARVCDYPFGPGNRGVAGRVTQYYPTLYL